MSLTDVELDRLADYTADALDPREAVQVATLIRTDPRWAQAYRDLAAADAAVRADLRLLSGLLPMPADVVARVDAALTAVGASSAAGGTASDDLAPVIPLDRARSRRRKVYAGIAAAAAAVAVLGGGLTYALQNTTGGANFTASSPELARGDSQDAGALPPPAPTPSTAWSAGVSIVSSGLNYTLRSLPGLAAQVTAGAAGAPAVPDATAQKSSEVPNAVREAVPSPLSRLTDPSALAACLQAVVRTHPGTVSALDYARYENAPALVVVVRQPAGAVVVAVGPECGVNGSSELANAPA